MDTLKDINFNAFEERTANDFNMQKELLLYMQEELKIYEADMLVALRTENVNKIKEKIHKTKNAVGIFGFEKLFDRLNNIENDNNAVNLDLETEIKQIFSEIKYRMIEIQKYIDFKIK
jgi:hypothetical protein